MLCGLFNLNYRQALLTAMAILVFGGIPTNRDALDRLRAKRGEADRTRQAKQNDKTGCGHCRLWREFSDRRAMDRMSGCEALMNAADINYRMEVLDCPN